MATTFIQLNDGWNAEPNSPEPRIEVDESTLKLTFYRNWMMFPSVVEDSKMNLEFHGCSKYRIGKTNDEGWYKGQCRFSKIAPKWGEFYEIQGETLDYKLDESEWKLLAGRGPTKRYLFYFRDETFECDAESFEIFF